MGVEVKITNETRTIPRQLESKHEASYVQEGRERNFNLIT